MMNRRELLTKLGCASGCLLSGNLLTTDETNAMPNYPEPVGLPGEPFEDPNCKLVVMNALLKSKKIDLGTKEEFFTFVLGREFNEELDGYDFIQPAYDYLVRYPLKQSDIETVEKLQFDGGLDIYSYAFLYWDGESEEFDVKSIRGLAACKNLRSLSIISMMENIDLKQLKDFRNLEKISLDANVSNIEALLDMPNLKNVRMLGDEIFKEVQTPGHPTRRVFEVLKSRNVTVRVRWISWMGEGRPAAFE